MAGAEPRKLLPPSLQYLLATQSRIITVTHEGVRLKIASIDRWYCGSPRLGGLIGEKLIVRFNHDVPEWLVATHPPSDPKAIDPFIIEASPYLPAMAASKEDLRKAGRQRNSFYNFGSAIHREILRHGHLIPILQPTLVPELNNIGESQINAEDAQPQQAADQRAAKRTAAEMLQRAGLDPEAVKNPTLAIEALQGFDQLRDEITRREAQL